MIRWFIERRYPRGVRLPLESELSALHPGKDSRKLWMDMYVKKIRLMLILLFLGIVVIFLYTYTEQQNKELSADNTLKKNNYKEGKKELSLEAVINEESYDVDFSLQEEKLTKEETEALFTEIEKQLPDIILNGNASLENVRTSLNLITKYKDYPVKIKWETDSYSVLREDGSIGDVENTVNGREVILRAIFSYEEWKKDVVIRVRVFPPLETGEDVISRKLLQEIERIQLEKPEEDTISLPETLGGESIIWKEKEPSRAGIMFLFLFLLLFLLAKKKDEEIKEEWQKRNRCLTLEYASFVGKLQLMLGSGLSLRNAMEKMVSDYKKVQKKGGEKKYAYEELLHAFKKMEGGLSEAEVWMGFGNRCGLLCYKKLVTLLLQNQRKGSQGLLFALENEVKNAFEERKQAAKKLGEEAETKLLLPMMMMMAMVMLMIMIPAYLSFGSI